MADYKHMYHIMLHAAEQVITEIDQANYGKARKILIEAEQAAEDVYLDGEDSHIRIMEFPQRV